MGAVKGKDGNRWVHVRLPGGPAGTPAGSSPTRRSARRPSGASSSRRGRARSPSSATACSCGLPAVVPKPATPTPYGQFFVEEALAISPQDVGGPYALAISARSDIFQEFEGGPGQIGIHGTDGLSEPLGSAASHGCIRLARARSRGSPSASAAGDRRCRVTGVSNRLSHAAAAYPPPNGTRPARDAAVPGDRGGVSPARGARIRADHGRERRARESGRAERSRSAARGWMRSRARRAAASAWPRRTAPACARSRTARTRTPARAGRPTARRSPSSPIAARPGNAQLYALEAGVLGEARRLTDAPGIVEHHEWSPDGTRILLLVAGHGAEQTDALGSGTLGPRPSCPRGCRSSTRARTRASDAARSTCSTSRAASSRQASPDEANVWEATWCGDARGRRHRLRGRRRGRLVWRRARAHRPRRAHRAHAAPHRRPARLGLRLARRHAVRRGRGGLQRSRDRRRRRCC